MVATQPEPRVFLIDRADAPQSLIMAGLLAPSTKAADALDLDIANSAFGGTFTSRLNMNLREQKHWTYGAKSSLPSAQGQRPWLLNVAVQTGKTAESVQEIIKEVGAVVDSNPFTDTEIARIRAQLVRALPGKYETSAAAATAILGILAYDRPDDYVQTLKARIDAVSRDSAEAALSTVMRPESLTWVIVGDLSKIEAPIRALNLGRVEVLDGDGEPVDPEN